MPDPAAWPSEPGCRPWPPSAPPVQSGSAPDTGSAGTRPPSSSTNCSQNARSLRTEYRAISIHYLAKSPPGSQTLKIRQLKIRRRQPASITAPAGDGAVLLHPAGVSVPGTDGGELGYLSAGIFVACKLGGGVAGIRGGLRLGGGLSADAVEGSLAFSVACWAS